MNFNYRVCVGMKMDSVKLHQFLMQIGRRDKYEDKYENKYENQNEIDKERHICHSICIKISFDVPAMILDCPSVVEEMYDNLKKTIVPSSLLYTNYAVQEQH